MSLVAGKALSSARMSDAVLSQSSLMGSQQFQDGENEGEGPYAWGTLGKFLEAPPPAIFTSDCSPLLYIGFRGRWEAIASPRGLDTKAFPTCLHREWVYKEAGLLVEGRGITFVFVKL